MARELAFVLINPYPVAKSRTGGIIARYTARTGLRLVAARLFGPSEELVQEYADLVRHADPEHADTCAMLADYIQRCYRPNPQSGKARRVLMLLFEGENAVERIWKVTGSARSRPGSGQTVRDTFGDYVTDAKGDLVYFEPAVLVAPSLERCRKTLRLWSEYSPSDGGIIQTATDVSSGENVETTLVMLKPDNFRIPSLRPGNIIDALSSSGLRIIGARMFCMTVAQAEAFYGPVRDVLRKKFRRIGGLRAARALSEEFGFPVSEDDVAELCDRIGPHFADEQFEQIVEFMTGYRPGECSEEQRVLPGKEECLALVYDGVGAIATIRSILGATDPLEAEPGSVRREFGRDVMVNAAHASDSVENAEREIRIINVAYDAVSEYVRRYYG